MNAGESERYSRQILFERIGQGGQQRIGESTVAIVGCGALGSFQAEALTRAGVGRLRIIDRDYVDITNLQRQWLFDEADAADETPKVIAAVRRLTRVNSHVVLEPFVADVTPSNAEELLSGCHLILDGTDNFETRYLLNDLSVKLSIPWIYGAAIGSYGIVLPVVPGQGPCFSCVYPDPPSDAQPTCDLDGVLSSITATVAAAQVAAALRLLVGWPSFRAVLQTFDVWEGTSKQIGAGNPDANCRVCAERSFAYLDGAREVPVSLCGRNAVQLHEIRRPLDLQQLALRLRPHGNVRVNEFALRVAIPKFDLTFFPDGRAIVKGTTDVAVARSVYAKIIGA